MSVTNLENKNNAVGDHGTMGEKNVRMTIDNLIKAGTSYDIEALEHIYHQDLQVIILDPSGRTMVSDKNSVKNMFKTKRDNDEPPLNTWADYHLVDVNDKKAHVLLSRRIKLMEEEQKFAFSIDLIYSADQWKVLREVVFVLPEST